MPLTPGARLSARSPLRIEDAHDTSYCIPLWLRDEQITLALARPDVGRIQAHYEKRTEPAAIVGFGSSLHQTWEQIRPFRYIFTCSGSHRFLIDRGLIPTWHVEVDPRAHKVQLLGAPHPDVTYLPSSTCHPAYFDHLKGFRAELWHVFSNEADAMRTLPHGEWALTGGPDVGMRALVIARFLGFTDLHIFGMDGCYGEEATHAGPHPNHAATRAATCAYEGQTYRTTAPLLECAKALWHELDELSDVTATFYGEGLIQAMAKHHVRPPTTAKRPTIGIVKEPLISAEYAALNRQLHQENLAYGVGGERYAPMVKKLTRSLKTKDVLDYGCGKGRLGRALPFHIQEYDPAIPGKAESPKPADIVVCTDVLEHVEPDRLSYVLADLGRCIRQVGFLVIHTGGAVKHLPDGRNTHLIQEGEAWWRERLGAFFQIGMLRPLGAELHIVVGPKQNGKRKALA